MLVQVSPSMELAIPAVVASYSSMPKFSINNLIKINS